MSATVTTKAHQARRLDVPDLEGFAQRVAEVNTARDDEVNTFPRLYVDQKIAGYMRPEVATRLLGYSDTFVESTREGFNGTVLEFAPGIADTQEARTRAVDRICRYAQ